MIQLIKEKILENKISTVIIIILTIVIIVMQTKLSFKDSKIENLNIEIKKIQESNKLETNKNNSFEKEEKSSNNKNSSYFESIKERFIKIGETQNKVYDEKLNGKLVNSFSWIDGFEITDKQIENLLKGLSGEKFKINLISKNTNKVNSYKIELLE